MPIQLPIELPDDGPLEPPPESPYGQCGMCQYIGLEIQEQRRCPECGKQLAGHLTWPPLELQELWHEQVFLWNNQRAELATAVAAFYYEASWFNLLYWATCWLHPELNWLGCEVDEVHKKHIEIWKHLATLTNNAKIDKALNVLFAVDRLTMLRMAVGQDASAFQENFDLCRKWRNEIAHRGRRIFFNDVPVHEQADVLELRHRMLRASLRLVPECWVVFSEIWNTFLHPRMRNIESRSSTGDR